MYIDRDEASAYPFKATFYRKGVDEDKPLDEQEEVEVVVFTTQCDIQEASHSRYRDFITASYVVYFPFNNDSEDILVRRGDLFRSDMYGMPIDGKVIGVFPSQLDGCLVYIQNTEV